MARKKQLWVFEETRKKVNVLKELTGAKDQDTVIDNLVSEKLQEQARIPSLQPPKQGKKKRGGDRDRFFPDFTM